MAPRREIHQQVESFGPYVRLLEEGELLKTKSNGELISRLKDLRWVVQGRRKGCVEPSEKGRDSIPLFLNNSWPEWRECARRISAAGYRFDLSSWLDLEFEDRMAKIELPSRAHHKTVASCFGMHSKAKSRKFFQERLKAVSQTTDQSLRILPNAGLMLKCHHSEISCSSVEKVLGGVLPKLVFTVENLGAFVDWPSRHPDCLVVFSPGKDTVLTLLFLGLLPDDVRFFHFGDLDPDGIKIARFLKERSGRDMELLAPEFWEDYLPDAFEFEKGKEKWDKVPQFCDQEPEVLRVLREQNRWMEQEMILLDPRFPEWLAERASR